MPQRRSHKMGASHRRQHTKPSARPVQFLLLAALVAVYVATPLIPGEAADQGIGIPLVMVLLILAVVWLASAWTGRHLQLRISWTGVMMLVLVAWHALSAVVMAAHGSPRPALNMLWEWIGLATGFLLARQLIATSAACRAMVAVLIAVAVALSVFGYYQFLVTQPSTLRAYEGGTPKQRQEMRQEAGVSAPEDSLTVRRFEDRMRSTEPYATFGLPNSLACFLSTWLVVALAVAASAWGRDPPSIRSSGAVVACAIVIGGCLLLTKSRTGYLASMLGLAVLWWQFRRRDRRLWWQIAVAGLLTVVLIVTLAALTGVVDIEMISEAPKSMQFRVQYWQATWQMIRDYPGLGCGPGNFSDYYLGYKLPHASEEVRDPHNFLLEIWATAGTPAMVVLVAVFACFGWRVIRHRWMSEPADVRQQTGGTGQLSGDPRPVYYAYAGAVMGVVLAFLVGTVVGYRPDTSLFLLGVPAGAIALWRMSAWVWGGRLTANELVIGVAVILINLLFAGGINYPGVATSLWLLVALSLNCLDEGVRTFRVPRWAIGGAAVAVVVLTIACYQTAYRPVLQPNSDPYNAISIEQQASVALRQWLASPTELNSRRFERLAKDLLSVNKRSSGAHRHVALWYLRVDAAGTDRRPGERAKLALRRAAALYPNSSMAHAELAWVCHLAGDEPAARLAAREALRLDQLTPYDDLRLAARSLFEDIPDRSLPEGSKWDKEGKSAERWMWQLQNEE